MDLEEVKIITITIKNKKKKKSKRGLEVVESDLTKNTEELILENGLIEEYDLKKVMFLVENNNENLKQLIKKRNYEEEQSKKELQKYNNFLNRIVLNKGKINTLYIYSNEKIKLRKFTKTTSGQNVMKELRNFLLTDYNNYKDIDFKNCIVSIILFISKILKIDTPTIKEYYNNREYIINEYYKGDKEATKNFINRTFLNSNEKKAKGTNDFEKNILKEIKDIHNNLNPLFLKHIKNIDFLEVLKLCRDEAKKSEENEKRKFIKEKGKSIFCNLEGKILSNLYHHYENKALVILTNYLYKTYNKLPHSLIFDGLIFNSENINIDEINNYLECLCISEKTYYFLEFLRVDIKPFKSDLLFKPINKTNEEIQEQITTYNKDTLKNDDKTNNIFNDLLKYGFNENDIINIIKNLLDPNKISIKSYSNNYNISFKTGFITNENTKEAKNLLLNYYDEPNEEIEENIITNYNKAEDIRDKAIEFLKNENEIFFIVKAPCGTGKTYIIINEVLKHYTPKKHKILYLTENNILNIRFTAEHKHFISHTDKEKDIKDYNYNSCSIQSIIKIINKEYDLLIIDELDSVLNSINDNITFNNSNSSRECFKMLCLLLQNTPKILLLDQDIEKQKINLIENIINIKNNSLKIHKLNINAFKDVENIIHTNKAEFEEDIKKDLLNNKKISMATASKTYGEHLINKLMKGNILHNKNLLFLHADTAKDDGKIDIYLKGKYISNDKIRDDININYDILKINKEHLNLNIDMIFLIYMSEIIEFYKFDIFIFTPSLKTGASLNKPYFNKVYCYTERRSIIPKQIIQMILRSRQIIDKKIVFYTPNYYYNKINLNDYEEETEKFNIKKIELSNEFKKTAGILNLKLKEDEEDLNYNTLQNIINYEDHKKKYFYIYELLNTLKRNLYNEPSFIYFDIKDTIEKKEDKEESDDKFLRWLDYDILNYEEYNIIKKKKEKDRSDHEYGSYKKTIHLNNCLNFKTYDTEDEKNEDLKKAHNTEFYSKFINDKAQSKIDFIKKVIDFQLKNNFEQSTIINEIHKDETKYDLSKTAEILNKFKINLLNFRNITITNKEFKLVFDIKNNFKQQYKIIRRRLKDIDLSIKYISVHNTRGETAKIEIQQQADILLSQEDPQEDPLLYNTHFYYLTKEDEDKEPNKEIKKWIDILNKDKDSEDAYLKTKNNKLFFNKRIQTKGEDGKKQNRILNFEVFKTDKGYITTQPKINKLKDYNEENILLLTYKPKTQSTIKYQEEEEAEEEKSDLLI